jgi:hypothetical protein
MKENIFPNTSIFQKSKILCYNFLNIRFVHVLILPNFSVFRVQKWSGYRLIKTYDNKFTFTSCIMQTNLCQYNYGVYTGTKINYMYYHN